jgi:hypothetical protein
MRYYVPVVGLLAVMGFAAEAGAAIGWAGNVWPLHNSNHVPTGPINVYAQVWKGGTTDGGGQGAGISAELRYTTNLAPVQTVAMSFQGDVGNNDEYTAQVPQSALVGASYVDVTVVFKDETDQTTFEVTGDQANNPPPLRYNVTNALPNDVAVTFTLCMSGTPTASPPCVIGSAGVIGTWGAGVPMTLVSGELYTVTVTFPGGSNPSFEYKYKREGCTDWECCGNRSVNLPTDGTTAVVLPPDSYNYAPIACGLGATLSEDKEVCFQVCMDGISGAPPCLIGSGSQLTNWTTGVAMTEIGPGLYQACVTWPSGTPIPVNVEYKFKKDGCSSWESVANRQITIDNATAAGQTLTNTWDNGAGVCTPVGTQKTSWGRLKILYR